MVNNDGKERSLGVVSRGIVTPIIKPHDDLEEIVLSSIERAIGKENINDGDIIGITEAVVAISQNNFVTSKDISKDITRKFKGAKELVILDPLQSRNRFMEILKSIAATPQLEKVYIVMTYPSDEVGNKLATEEAIANSGVNPYTDVLSVEKFYSKIGTPRHPFTGKNYVEEYQKACNGKAEIIFCNDFSKVPEICDNILVCSIHRKERTKAILRKSNAKNVLDLSDIMNESIAGSGFNEEFGLYGTNLMAGEKLKLMPRNCNEFVNKLQETIKNKYGKNVEVFVYGDGAFKDPVGGIWELADPQTTLGATARLYGTPKEVKLKYLASAHEDKTAEELQEIILKEKAERVASNDVTSESSLGTTPRQITDLLASLADLTTGSGDRQTPVVYITGYLPK